MRWLFVLCAIMGLCHCHNHFPTLVFDVGKFVVGRWLVLTGQNYHFHRHSVWYKGWLTRRQACRHPNHIGWFRCNGFCLLGYAVSVFQCVDLVHRNDSGFRLCHFYYERVCRVHPMQNLVYVHLFQLTSQLFK